MKPLRGVKYVTVAQAAKLLGRHRVTVWRHCVGGKIPDVVEMRGDKRRSMWLIPLEGLRKVKRHK